MQSHTLCDNDFWRALKHRYESVRTFSPELFTMSPAPTGPSSYTDKNGVTWHTCCFTNLDNYHFSPRLSALLRTAAKHPKNYTMEFEA